MSLLEIILIGIGLAMDAFAVSICKGLSMRKMNWKKAIIVGLYFGFFHVFYSYFFWIFQLFLYLGTNFESYITSIDHWIAFILLATIGINMLKEAFSKDCEDNNDSVDFKTMIILAIATSIDALAVGITFAFLKTKYYNSKVAQLKNIIYGG